jgi:hypothetical protein
MKKKTSRQVCKRTFWREEGSGDLFDGVVSQGRLWLQMKIVQEVPTMFLPFREHLDFGPTPYDQLQAKEGIPVIRGNVVANVMALELGR